MTQDQRTAINTQNAQHSTGPKTPEGKAKVSQNATTHGLSSAKPPQENPRFRDLLKGFQKDYAYPQSLTAQTWILELAHTAWKLEQIPSMEQQIEQESGLTLAEHFMQDKPTPLVKLWNLQLRLGGRFNSLVRKLETQSGAGALAGGDCPPCNGTFPQPARAPAAPLQNKPTSAANASLAEHPTAPTTPPTSKNPPTASPLQNKATSTITSSLKTLQKLAFAVNSIPLPI